MVKFSVSSPLDGLLDLACRDGIDIRPTLLRVLTDLYVQKLGHTAEEETQYVELALGLIEAVDAPTRAAVAAKLFAYAAAPEVLKQRLAGHGAQPDKFAAETPATDPPKPDIRPGRDLIEIFFAATARERCLILANLEVSEDPAPATVPAASETIRQLEVAALRRQTAEFSRLLERALDISHSLARRVTHDDSGEPIVIAAKALGMPGAVLQRILLFLNPVVGQSVERVHSLSWLFDDLSPATVARMVAIWREAGSAGRPVYESVHWDDEHRGARAAATPARHRVPRGGEEALPSPLKGRGRW